MEFESNQSNENTYLDYTKVTDDEMVELYPKYKPFAWKHIDDLYGEYEGIKKSKFAENGFNYVIFAFDKNEKEVLYLVKIVDVYDEKSNNNGLEIEFNLLENANPFIFEIIRQSPILVMRLLNTIKQILHTILIKNQKSDTLKYHFLLAYSDNEKKARVFKKIFETINKELDLNWMAKIEPTGKSYKVILESP